MTFSLRLKKRQDFLRAYNSGLFTASRSVVIHVYKRLPDSQSPRVGFTVSRKVGGAVQRNKVRRRLKEIFSCLVPLFPLDSLDIVVVARPPSLDKTYSDLKKECQSTLELSLKKKEKR